MGAQMSEPSLMEQERCKRQGDLSRIRHRSEVYLPQLALWESIRNGPTQDKRPNRTSRVVGFSTSLVVGFSYHKAADLRVCQAAL